MNQGREHSARCIVTSNTRNVNATATVLLVHIGHDAEHNEPARNRREQSAKRKTKKTNIATKPLPLSTMSAASKRARGGTRRPPLPPLLPLSPPRLGRGANELSKPGPLLRRPELDRDSEQDIHLLLLLGLLLLLPHLPPLRLLLLRAHRHVISWRRPWARVRGQCRPRVRRSCRTFF